MFFLEHEDWSPRFEPSFFTIKLNSHATRDCAPAMDEHLARSIGGGRTEHPAVYFNVEVLCGRRTTRVCPRRYSQFARLLELVKSTGPTTAASGGGGGAGAGLKGLTMPPKTCFFHDDRDENFLASRREELRGFLVSLLKEPGVPDHPAVVAFLELDHEKIDDERCQHSKAASQNEGGR